MKKVAPLVIAFLFALLQGLALEPVQLQSLSKNPHTQETAFKNPSKGLACIISQPEYLVTVNDLTSSFTAKDSNKNGWPAIKTYDTLLTAQGFQYLNYSKWLIIHFNTTAIIFPFHYHW